MNDVEAPSKSHQNEISTDLLSHKLFVEKTFRKASHSKDSEFNERMCGSSSVSQYSSSFTRRYVNKHISFLMKMHIINLILTFFSSIIKHVEYFYVTYFIIVPLKFVKLHDLKYRVQSWKIL